MQSSRFGLARLTASTGITSTGRAVGSPSYMSPEQVQEMELDARTDQYSLGIVFYELVTGTRPFTGKKPKLKFSLKKLTDQFVSLFWNNEQSCLYDLINQNGKDSSIRPNQVFAVSLPYKLLDREKGRALLATVEKYLLTDWGLRTLSPASPNYRQHYGGDVWQRDTAYHQGTVWAWLLGPCLSACLWAHGNSETLKAGIVKKLGKFLSHVSSAGIGHISEVFDAKKPFEPGGCYAQAWSIATTLELMVEIWGKNR